MNTDERVRVSLTRLADSVCTEAPPLSSLFATSATVRPHRPRRARRVGLAVGVSVVIAAGGVAAAAVFVPDAVRHNFGNGTSPQPGLPGIRVGQAVLEDTYTDPGGTTFELWAAPDSAGETCRTVIKSGLPIEPERFVALCTPVPFGTPQWSLRQFQTYVLGDQLAIAGVAPGANSVNITFVDGTALTVPVVNGSFFTVAPQVCTAETRCEVAAIASFDIEDREIDRIPQ